MPSRRKRKRLRQQAEATAKTPRTRGGWGQGVPATRSDLVLLRQAIHEDWPVPDDVWRAVVGDLLDDLESPDTRRIVSVARVFLAAEQGNLRLVHRENGGIVVDLSQA